MTRAMMPVGFFRRRRMSVRRSRHHRNGLRALSRCHPRRGPGRVGAEERHVTLSCAHWLTFAETHEVGTEVLGRLIALIGGLRERLHHDRLQVGGNRAVELRWRWHGAMHVLTRDFDRRVTNERGTTGQHLVEDDAE